MFQSHTFNVDIDEIYRVFGQKLGALEILTKTVKDRQEQGVHSKLRVTE